MIISDDNDPPEGTLVDPGSTVQIQKQMGSSSSVTFTAIDTETEETLLLNKKQDFTVTPSDKQQLVRFLIERGKAAMIFMM